MYPTYFVQAESRAFCSAKLQLNANSYAKARTHELVASRLSWACPAERTKNAQSGDGGEEPERVGRRVRARVEERKREEERGRSRTCASTRNR